MRGRWSLAAMLSALAFGGFLFLGSARVARADDRGCWDRIRNEEWKLQRDIQRHGFFSRQAEHRREKIRRERQRCSVGRHGFRDDRRFDRWEDRRNGRDRDWDDRRRDEWRRVRRYDWRWW